MSAHTNGFAYKWAQNTKNLLTTLMSVMLIKMIMLLICPLLLHPSLPVNLLFIVIFRVTDCPKYVKALIHHLGNSLSRRSQPVHSKQAPARSVPISHSSFPVTRGPQVSASHTIVSMAPTTSITASPMHSNITNKKALLR